MNYKYSMYMGSRMVMNILSISVLLLGLVIIHLFEFNSAKATDLSSNRNSNLGYSNVNMMLNGTLQTLSSNNTNSNSSSTASCSGSKSFNVSRPLPCQEETSKAPPEELSSGNVRYFYYKRSSHCKGSKYSISFRNKRIRYYRSFNR